jgi:hypothetical protein
MKINARDIIFRVNENYYSLHIGQSVAEAMRKTLNGSELKGLGLAEASPLVEAKQ